MNIQQATIEAIATGAYMARSVWGKHFSIEPTNSTENCVAYGDHGKGPKRGWQPNADDLTANDWIVMYNKINYDCPTGHC